MTTFQVFCKGTARRWLPYSEEFKTLEEAQACLRYAESLGNYSITGAPISYKIVELMWSFLRSRTVFGR